MDVSYPEVKSAGSFGNKVGGGISTEQEQAGDFLAIEDLLDFSNEDIGGSYIDSCCGIQLAEDSPPAPAVSSITVPSGVDNQCPSKASSSALSVAGERQPLKLAQSNEPLSVFDAEYIAGPGELCVPCDDVAELEWLSNFVEESFSSGDGAVQLGGGLAFLPDEKALISRGSDNNKQQSASPTSILDQHQFVRRTGTHHSTSSTTSSNSSHGGLSSLCPDHLYMSRPGRARTKRRRTAVCFWNTRILSITDDCNILEASSTSKLTNAVLHMQSPSSSSDSEGGATFALGYDDSEDFYPRPPSKKVARGSKYLKGISKATGGGAKQGAVGAGGPAADGRRCLHCGSQRTPQWRAGPMGPKTLCNACGVRYKSGRLLPEYRPAASPTFVESVHSNSHRRVLEMRRQQGEAAMCGGGHGEKQCGVIC